MKTIIMADLHLGKFWKTNNAAFSRAKKLINNYLNNLDIIIKQLSNELVNLIIAGDIYDSVHNNIELLCFVKNELSKRLQYFNCKGKVFVIAGNHEIFIDKSGQQQTILTIGLDSYNNKIIGSGVSNWFDNINNINYIFIPFQNNIENILGNEVQNYLYKNIPNVIIAHTTPKEVFYHGKYEIGQYIDYWTEEKDIKIPYIILGHYHKPLSFSYKDTIVISIGNSYYHTIDDLNDYNNEKYKKRFIIIDGIDNVTSINYNLPNVNVYNVNNQSEFENIDFSNINKEEDIIYIKGKELIDYSKLMFEGYDIYFDLLEDTDKNINNIQESLSDAINNSISGKTLNDRWDTYINCNNILSNKEKNVATMLFNKRNDLDINKDNLFKLFIGEGLEVLNG